MCVRVRLWHKSYSAGAVQNDRVDPSISQRAFSRGICLYAPCAAVYNSTQTNRSTDMELVKIEPTIRGSHYCHIAIAARLLLLLLWLGNDRIIISLFRTRARAYAIIHLEPLTIYSFACRPYPDSISIKANESSLIYPCLGGKTNFAGEEKQET